MWTLHVDCLILTGLDLQSGAQYRFIVTAVNRAGLKVDAFSNGFTVDFTPPTISKAWVGNETSNLLYHSDSSRITVRYRNVIITSAERTVYLWLYTKCRKA